MAWSGVIDKFRMALVEISSQRLPEEISDETDPDYETGYDLAIRAARAAIAI